MAKTKAQYKPIDNGFEAWHFLRQHPKFWILARTNLDKEPTAEFIAELEKDRIGVYQDRNKNWYRVHPLKRRALESNLDISYKRVNGEGNIDDDNSKNIYSACWLEFGEIQWGYHTESEDGREYIIHYHDDKLNCGAATFDEALIELANLVLKRYGDYERPKWIYE